MGFFRFEFSVVFVLLLLLVLTLDNSGEFGFDLFVQEDERLLEINGREA